MEKGVVDVITIENLEQKMSRWNPDSPNQLYALVDMGSNGIRFSISDLSPPNTRLLKCIYRERAAISLFDALSGSSPSATSSGPLLFPEETIRRVSQTLARFRAIAVDDYGVPADQVTVFATEAMRRAQNAAAMLEAIQAAVPGLRVHVLTPQVETLFGAVGARSGFINVKGLFLDLGGGSVQMTYLDTYAARAGTSEDSPGYEVLAALAGQSLPFGAARLIKVLESSNAEVQAAEKSQLRNGLSEAFRTLCASFPSLAAAAAEVHEDELSRSSRVSGIDVYLCGGGFRGYGSMLMHNNPIRPYPIPSVASFTVSGKLFGRTNDMLKVNTSFDGKIFGMSNRRRAQFPAIVEVVDALVAAIPPIRSVTFCAGGNREGALMMRLPPELRESNPLDFSVALAGLPAPSIPGDELGCVQDVLDTLRSAFPTNLDLSTVVTVFSLQLGAMYASQIWNRLGEDADCNASAALHHAVNCPDQPGLTHLARAVLGVTLCARWGANLALIDQQLHQNLKAIMEAADPGATFWADFTGAVTAALAMVLRKWPRTRRSIQDNIRFRSTAEHGKRVKILLEILIAEGAARGLDPDNLLGLFKKLGKQQHDGPKVIVTVTVGPLR